MAAYDQIFKQFGGRHVDISWVPLENNSKVDGFFNPTLLGKFTKWILILIFIIILKIKPQI